MKSTKPENVRKAIAIMERARPDNFDMGSWQCRAGLDDYVARTEKELHACGNTACFAGYVALSPEFHEDGGRINPDGAPFLPRCDAGPSTIAKWLGVSIDIATGLTSCDNGSFYPVPWYAVKPQHVIAKLKELL